MFALRTIFKDGTQSNTDLGKHYLFVGKFESQEQFDITFYEFYEVEDIDKELYNSVYAFVIGEGGRLVIPLYDDSHNYIMSDNGRTFANLSL